MRTTLRMLAQPKTATLATALLLLMASAWSSSLLALSPDAGIKALHWLSGRWCNGAGASVSEEYWLPARGELMLGVSRTVKNERAVAFEFLRVAEVDGVVTYLAQPEGRPETAFKRTGGGENWVRFENPQHDFPTRIEYRREGDVLTAEIAGPGKEGKEKVIPFPFQRCPDVQ